MREGVALSVGQMRPRPWNTSRPAAIVDDGQNGAGDSKRIGSFVRG
jgi:hypothetical protein